MSSTIWGETLTVRVQCDLKTNAISVQEEKVKVSHQFTYNTYKLCKLFKGFSKSKLAALCVVKEAI